MAGELTERKLPHSIEAEQSVLGSVLIDPESFTKVATILKAEDFYIEDHAAAFEAMQRLFLQNRTIDVVTLVDELIRGGVYTKESGLNYMKVLAETVPTASNVLDYARIVKEKSTLRALINACEEIILAAYAGSDDAADIVNDAEQKIFAIAQGSEQQNFSTIREIIVTVYEHLRLLRENREEALGTPSGFTELDKLLVGMAPSDLILIGARPGMGKTSFALNIAAKAARRTKKSVCIFSLEMSKEQLTTRMLSSEGMIDNYALRTGDLDPTQWSALAGVAGELSEYQILIDDTTGLTITGMKAKLRRVKNLGLVVIDYLQLMTSDRKIDNRVQEVSDISRNLKLMAKELNVPVICCAQLSRAPEGRTDKTPQLSDLRDSGAIEQDADVV
ncbi:MAG: replicative DNA helicase, partial [Clostridiales bacterium]|nr:replicative DNA helicase [Clostridiales bacterium]